MIAYYHMHTITAENSFNMFFRFFTKIWTTFFHYFIEQDQFYNYIRVAAYSVILALVNISNSKQLMDTCTFCFFLSCTRSDSSLYFTISTVSGFFVLGNFFLKQADQCFDNN